MIFHLKDVFDPADVYRDGMFEFTSGPGFRIPAGLCYAVSRVAVERLNRELHVSALIVSENLVEYVDRLKGVVVSRTPDQTYYDLHDRLLLSNEMSLPKGRSIDERVEIEPGVILPAHVSIGAGVVIKSGAVIENYTIIGNDSYVGQGAVLGAIGMQSLKVNGVRRRICFGGGVRIGRNCEILAGAVIQKPYQCFYTEISDECQISVKTSIGHGSKIGKRTMVAGGVTLSGNVKLGDDVWIGPGSVLRDGLNVGNGARVRIGSVVVKDVPSNEEVSGNFALPHRITLRQFSVALTKSGSK